MITFDDFQKLDLRIAKVLEVERVEGSEKLLCLQVDLGQERRQIIAGIGNVYSLESLIGKKIVIVANLEPRKIMGFESQGMLLAADDGSPVLLTPEKEVALGIKIR